MMNQQAPRRVIPRWRISSLAARTDECKSTATAVAPEFKEELLAKEREFNNLHSVPVAAELMYIASQANDIDRAKRAAKLLLENKNKITSNALIKTAEAIQNDAPNLYSDIPTPREFIKRGRQLLNIEFNNPVLLVDMARAFTINGHTDTATKYINAAIQLAPESRFITRSAARFFLHVGEEARAHTTLSRNSRINVDPWLLASEISVATIQGKKSKFLRHARGILNDEGKSAHITELASALATLELTEGDAKPAKKLFKLSLNKPNDNSLAQAEWAAQKIGLVVQEKALQVPYSYEANSHNSYRHLNVEDAIAHAKFWFLDESFSSRPAFALVHLHSLLENYEEAKKYAAEASRLAKGHDVAADLNLAFTHIMCGEAIEGQNALFKASNSPEIKGHRTQLLANAGALAYFYGMHEEGRKFYEDAIKNARLNNSLESQALAYAYFARTAIRHGDPAAQKILEQALDFEKVTASPGAIFMLKKMVDNEKKKRLEAVAQQRNKAPKWVWDRLTNTLRQIE